jgi:putative inorganic carbon (HCO3(-)) transporter
LERWQVDGYRCPDDQAQILNQTESLEEKVLMLRNWLTWQTGTILLICLVVVAASLSGLVYPSEFMPLFVLGGLVGLALVAVCVFRPELALYVTLFALLLPVGLIPNEVQSFFNRYLTLLALGVWLLNAIIEHRPIRLTLSTVFMFVFLLWGVVTLFWAESFGAGIFALQVYAFRLILFLLIFPNLIATEKRVFTLLKLMAINGWLLVLVSLSLTIVQGYTPGMRLQVLDVNENEIGILSLLFIPGVVWHLVQRSSEKQFWSRVAVIVYFAMAIGLIAMSGSRGSAISFLVTLIAFWFWKSTRPLGKLGLVLVGLAGLVAPFIFKTLIERFMVTFGDTALGGRESIWSAAWQLIRGHIMGGVGIGNSSYAIMPYLQTVRYIWAHESVAFHNPILAIWGDTGLIGLAFYLGVLIAAVGSFISSYSYFRTQGTQRMLPYFPLLAAVFLGFMTSWIKGGGMESNKVYFLMIALLLIPGNIRANEPWPLVEDDDRIQPG